MFYSFVRLKSSILVLISLFQMELAFANRIDEVTGQNKVTKSKSEANDEKNQMKAMLKSLPPAVRLEYIARAEVFDPKVNKLIKESPSTISSISISQSLNQVCGSVVNYSMNDSKPNLSWPTVNCKYIQDNKSLSGATKKFYCEFQEKNKEGKQVLKKRKVKYANSFNIGKYEVVPTLLASTLARLIGFHTESYCPAKIKCVNCPSDDPWENDRASAAPSSETYELKYAMIEMPADLMTITPNTPRVSPTHPHGIQWPELTKAQDTNESSAIQKLIDRETWFLWINFLMDTDANFFNQRVSCDSAELVDSQVNCLKPVVYTHDYGQSFFRRFKYERWKELPPLIQRSDDSCQGGFSIKVLRSEVRGSDQSELYMAPLISAEAKDSLVSRLSLLTEAQLVDIAKMANVEKLYRVDPKDFAQTVRAKVQQMAQIRCKNFETGTTVLAPK